MKTNSLKHTICGLLAAFFIATTVPCHAGSNYVGALLRNNTHLTVTYLARVNGGQWQMQRLAPGASIPYGYNFGQGPNATFEIAFDNTLADGRVTYSTYRLKMWGCGVPQNGWLQCFIITNSGRNVWISG